MKLDSTETDQEPLAEADDDSEYLEGAFQARQAAFSSAMEFWTERTSSDRSEAPLFPASIDTIIDTAATLEHYFYYGRKI